MSVPNNGIARLLSSLSRDANRRGLEFEELCRWYLLSDPVYRSQLSGVWLWKEWPDRWGDDEAGIDLVAETNEGKLWAIQAKAYDPSYSVKKADVDSFLSESARPEFSYRLLMASTNKLARHAERVMKAQEKPVGQLLLHDLERAEVTWPASVSDLRPSMLKPKEPRPHQRAAIDAIVASCADADRGQVIMACGTGKTLVALWSAEALKAERTLVLVPSLSLLRQTIQEWAVNSSREFEFLPVCSDDTVRNLDQVVASVAELGFPATGDPQAVREFLTRPGPRVIFSTYQSSPVVASALESTAFDFDLAIADEAHRCAGPAASDFATILNNELIPVKKRIFMTATPRYFTGKVLRAGASADYEIVSMDDEDHFGRVFHRLTFADAIERDLLSDYRVLVIGVDDDMYLDYAKEGLFVTRDGVEVTDARSLATQIGLARAIRKYDLRRVITFHSRVKAARDLAESLPEVVDWLPPEARPSGRLWAEHVSGEMNAGMRETRLGRLREIEADARGVLSNARCLSEGVDVPALDGVAFVDPKKSAVDIAQAVGRALRKSEEKELGTIVIPVFIQTGDDTEIALDSSAFRPVWDVVRALREHDSELAEALDNLRRGLGGQQSAPPELPSKLVVDLPRSVGMDFARAFDVRLVELCTANFEHWFGLLTRYVAREGDARVPQHHVESGLRLGTWVSSQRTEYRSGHMESEHIRRLEALPGWAWNTHQAAWEAGFAALAAYVAREGHARVTKSHAESQHRLGIWVVRQRIRYRSGELGAEEIGRFEVLPGWTWDPEQDDWDAGFAALAAFVGREGNSRVRNRHVESGLRLGVWIGTQRYLFKKKKLRPERIEQLEAVPGWTWDRPEAAWKEGYEALRAYVRREGDSAVPQRHREGEYRLGVWLNGQRRLYKLGELPAERIARLDAVPGWTWDPYKTAWELSYAALLTYVEREGDARVPQNFVESGLKLGAWISNQRNDYGMKKIEPERIARLEAVPGWAWNKYKADWDLGFRALETYVEREGDARVPGLHEESGIRLGTWVLNRRMEYKSEKLDASKIARLEAVPGWTWGALVSGWEEGFAALAAYVVREGDARVPHNHLESGFKLGNWVARQRKTFQTGNLGDERANRLEAILGWTWSPQETDWEAGIEALSAIVARTGHSRVAQKHEESGFRIGTWTANRRQDYKSEKLDADQIQQLEAFPGWSWTPREAGWEAGFAALTAYVEREADIRVAQSHVESGFKLGNWVYNQRQRHTSGNLSPERVARLETLPGWYWSGRGSG